MDRITDNPKAICSPQLLLMSNNDSEGDEIRYLGLNSSEQVKQVTPSYTWYIGLGMMKYHPAGDVTRVSVVPRKVTVKIRDTENWRRGCRDKNRLKRQKFLFV